MAANQASNEAVAVLSARVVDLRSELEAQLRSVVRIEQHLRKARDGGPAPRRQLLDALRSEFAGMLANNGSIKTVLKQLITDVEPV
jgi:hypothetical protein